MLNFRERFEMNKPRLSSDGNIIYYVKKTNDGRYVMRLTKQKSQSVSKDIQPFYNIHPSSWYDKYLNFALASNHLVFHNSNLMSYYFNIYSIDSSSEYKKTFRSRVSFSRYAYHKYIRISRNGKNMFLLSRYNTLKLYVNLQDTPIHRKTLFSIENAIFIANDRILLSYINNNILGIL